MKRIRKVLKIESNGLRLGIVAFVAFFPLICKGIAFWVNSSNPIIYLFELFYVPIAIIFPFFLDEIQALVDENTNKVRSSFIKWIVATIFVILLMIIGYGLVDYNIIWNDSFTKLSFFIVGLLLSIALIIWRFFIIEKAKNNNKKIDEIKVEEDVFGDYT